MLETDMISCISPASTSILTTPDYNHQSQPSSSSTSSSSPSSSSVQLGGRAIDRHNPIIRDPRRSTPVHPATIHSKSSAHKHSTKSKKSISSNKCSKTSSDRDNRIGKTKKKESSTKSTDKNKDCADKEETENVKTTCVKRREFATPAGSSRYLLSDAVSFEGFTDYEPGFELVLDEPEGEIFMETNAQPSDSKPNMPSSRKSAPNQVVVLRVSLHCRGCERKVRKQLSRMEGVKSFSIDFAAKKVTIVGDVTPQGVLESVSKVKNAQFWPTTSADVDTSILSINK